MPCIVCVLYIIHLLINETAVFSVRDYVACCWAAHVFKGRRVRRSGDEGGREGGRAVVQNRLDCR